MKLKIVSLNVWDGGTLMDEVVAFLKQQDGDILLLQEVRNGENQALPAQHRTLQVLKDTLGYSHSAFVPALCDLDVAGGTAPEGSAILSKFPIASSSYEFFDGHYIEDYRNSDMDYPRYPHALLHAVCNTPVGEVNVFNLHGVWDLDGDNYSDKRKIMANAVIDAVKGKQRVIVAGDTNAKMTNQAILDIETELVNVFGRELTSTFNMRRKDNPGYGTAAVDTIFVSHDITVLEKQCPAVDVSDHLPVTAVIELKE